MKTGLNTDELNTHQVAEMLGVTRQMIWIYVDQGKLKATQYSKKGQLRFNKKDVLSFKEGK